MHSRHSMVPVLASVAMLAACGSDQTSLSAPDAQHIVVNGAGVEAGLTIYGLGSLRRATPRTPCTSGPYRQFDFWVGSWVVMNAQTGVVSATNRIDIDLDGCAVIENWKPDNGFWGRSLNSYDAETGQWNQTWVPEGGRPFRMSGGLRPDGVMDLIGEREPWFGGPNWVDHYTWTQLDNDRVVQAFTFDGPAHFEGEILYTRSADLPTTTSSGGTSCFAGGFAAEVRLLDFTLGRWTVSAANGLELGTSEITLDPTSSGCLLIEDFSTRKGYRALAWMYYDPVEDRFYRSYADSEGSRLELRGAPAVDPLVLEGEEPLPGAPGARLRMSWQAISVSELLQTWEVSKDGGSTWAVAQTLTFTRR
jgi:hypothetical protein